MKTLLPLLWITGTVVIAAWVWPRPPRVPVTRIPAVVRSAVPGPTLATANSRSKTNHEPMVSRRQVSAYSTPWKALEAGNLGAFVDLLRASGCPEATVQVFALAALGRRHQQRLEQPLREAVQKSGYWQANPWQVSGMQSEDLGQQMRRARRELDQDLSRLLGLPASLVRGPFESTAEGSAWESIPEPQRQAFLELSHRQELERAELEATLSRDALGRYSDPESRAALRAQRERHRAEVAGVLGPEEAERRELRESVEADYVRQVLPEAKNEEEFRRLVQAAREVGVQREDVMEHYLSRHGAGVEIVEGPSVRDQVLERYRAVSAPEQVAELEQELALDQARTDAQEVARREAASLSSLQSAAREVGVELSDPEVRQLAEAIQRRGAELEQELGPPPKNPTPAEEAVLRERLRKEFEATAVSVLGERGRGIVEGMLPGR